MFSRNRLDIRWRDLMWGMAYSLYTPPAPRQLETLHTTWSSEGVCLSPVRAGWATPNLSAAALQKVSNSAHRDSFRDKEGIMPFTSCTLSCSRTRFRTRPHVASGVSAISELQAFRALLLEAFRAFSSSNWETALRTA